MKMAKLLFGSVFFVTLSLTCFGKSELHMTFVFDENYDSKQATLNNLYQNWELDKIFKKNKDNMMFYFQGNNANEMSLDHAFTEEKSPIIASVILSSRGSSCNPKSRIQEIRNLKGNCRTIIVVDYLKTEFINELEPGALPNAEIKFTKFDNTLRLYEHYYKKYEKELKNADIHIIFWWPTGKPEFEIKTIGNVDLNNLQFGERLNLSVSTKTPKTIFHVNWYEKNLNNPNGKERMSSGSEYSYEQKGELTSDHDIQWFKYSVVEHVYVCAEIKECQQELCIELKPSEECEEIGAPVWRPDVKNGYYCKENKPSQVDDYGTHEMRQPNGSKIFTFVVEKQCGILNYKLEYRIQGGSFKSIMLQEPEAFEDFFILSADYAKFSDVFKQEDPVMEFRIVPSEVVKKFEGQATRSKMHKVILQKCN
jgi:hypothetical protein